MADVENVGLRASSVRRKLTRMPSQIGETKLMPTTRNALTTCMLFSGFILSVSCSRFDRANQARAAEIRKLSTQTFREAAELGRCDHDDCSRQEVGFAYAKKNHLENPDACYGKGGPNFIEGCRQYGEDIETAYRRTAEGAYPQ